jgi:hypothetical protein
LQRLFHRTERPDEALVNQTWLDEMTTPLRWLKPASSALKETHARLVVRAGRIETNQCIARALRGEP